MRCPYCDEQLPPDAVFCVACGQGRVGAVPAQQQGHGPTIGDTIRLPQLAGAALAAQVQPKALHELVWHYVSVPLTCALFALTFPYAWGAALDRLGLSLATLLVLLPPIVGATRAFEALLKSRWRPGLGGMCVWTSVLVLIAAGQVVPWVPLVLLAWAALGRWHGP
ncbi:MAG TPA: zinc ribbon domain-containing protein [Roseiflexaceae bacterium]|nr:zinc ribbon domain-containing protein [Roseiflexaceae bacterium]